MWVMGGLINTNDMRTGQMFSIDLSTSWSTSNPAYKRLPDGLADFAMANTLMADNQNWFILSNSTAYRYNLATSNWITIEEDNEVMGILRAATDPETGEVLQWIRYHFYGLLFSLNEEDHESSSK
jgi:hypothetical protein